MRCVLFASLLALAGVPATSQAFYGCCPPCVHYETRVVTCYRPVFTDVKVECLVPRVVWDERVDKVRVMECVPRWDKEVRTHVFYTPVWREEERDVVRCVMKPVTIVDPCTGCCWTTCCPEYVKERVRVRVCDYRPEKRDEVVQVCRWENVERVVERRCLVPRTVMEKAYAVRRECRYEPYAVTVCVPVLCYP